jgi:Flp pilus assembly pilin Flp
VRLSVLIRAASRNRLAAEERGQTVTEYGVILAVLIIALTGVVFALQTQIDAFIDKVAGAIAEILP